MKQLLITLAMLIVTASSAKAEDTDSLYTPSMLSIGTMVPDIVIDSIHNISLSSLRGRYVVLHFWASWCPDCRKDMPAMNELSYVYSSDSVVFIHISYDTDKAVWQKYIEDNKMLGLQVSELKKMRETQTYSLFGIKWIPAMYLVSPEGRVMLRTVKVEKLAERLKYLNYAKLSIPKNKRSRNPRFQGGERNLRYYLSHKIDYPREANNYGLEGVTTMRFTIERDGSISNVTVKDNRITVEDKLPFRKLQGDEQNVVRQKALDAFAKEATRVIEEMPNWEPGLRYGTPVRVEYEMPINFRIHYTND
ncbi:MAG: thioredoxin-like domain-containing protein [Prevotella sp.]|nr:energy transducer TonB [Prevotella sp.]MCI6308932.1 energy transducer TonB [Prevotella sp.]MCI6462906.1 energy transducer TonB [Prevotella sp.]MCI6500326.1 energy transducer TonB [Prevotella sp.]MCI6554258.1 energy transducer TonB [Prevotella sp.]